MHEGQPSFLAAAFAYERQLQKNIAEDIQRCHETRERIYQTKFEFSPSFPFQPAPQQTVIEAPMTRSERFMQMVRKLFHTQLPGYVPRGQSSNSSLREPFSSSGYNSTSQTPAETSWWARFKAWCTPTWESKNQRDTHTQSGIPDGVPSLSKYQAAHPYSNLEKGQTSTSSNSSNGAGSPHPTAFSHIFRSVAKVAVPGLVFADEGDKATPATPEKESYVFSIDSVTTPSRPVGCRGTLCDTWVYCGCPYQWSCEHMRHYCPPPALPVLAARASQPAVPRVVQAESTEKKQNLLSKHVEWSPQNK
ncbi:hypothetical protein QFC22_002193 [Naganishia vaughanmartiniae]|uniref:Uncharacterized protein n=1 Tax=Naganishia vaughanmartiniae TaxID=1424756 RepID=A0ACC2XDX3_9TREE|nr:hypothetical protein QFC22_002193 [Naganishia vaughanmartiniae]